MAKKEGLIRRERDLKELSISKELFPFPRVNILRQLVYTWQTIIVFFFFRK